MEVVLVPFLKAIPGGQLTKHCYLEAYKFLMNTWNALPRPYRIRVHNNTLALVKNRILAADTAVKNAPVSTEAAQVDEQLLEEFLESTAPLDEPQIGSRNDDNDMPGDIDAYEEFVTYDHGESFDFGGDGEPSVPHAEPEMGDEIRKLVAGADAAMWQQPTRTTRLPAMDIATSIITPARETRAAAATTMRMLRKERGTDQCESLCLFSSGVFGRWVVLLGVRWGAFLFVIFQLYRFLFRVFC